MRSVDYETKKALLKRIKNQWGIRLKHARHGTPSPSALHWSDIQREYIEAQERVKWFITNSIQHRYH